MNGLLGAVLPFVVGAALLLLTAMAILAILRGLLNWGRGGHQVGCVLLLVLFILWLVTGLASGTSQSSGATAPAPTPAQVAE